MFPTEEHGLRHSPGWMVWVALVGGAVTVSLFLWPGRAMDIVLTLVGAALVFYLGALVGTCCGIVAERIRGADARTISNRWGTWGAWFAVVMYGVVLLAN